MMTGSPVHSAVARILRQTSRPSLPGSIRSSKTRSGRLFRRAARPRGPSPAVVTSISCLPRYSATSAPRRASSSMRSAAVRCAIQLPYHSRGSSPCVQRVKKCEGARLLARIPPPGYYLISYLIYDHALPATTRHHPVGRHPERTRERILASALREFSDKG